MDNRALDQAFGLRALGAGRKLTRLVLCSAVSEPGRPWAILNLAAGLQSAGVAVLVVDAVPGHGGSLLAKGLSASALEEVLASGAWDRVISRGPDDIPILAVESLAVWQALTGTLNELCLSTARGLSESIDVLLINAGTSASGAQLAALKESHELIVAVRPERQSVSKTYQMIQELSKETLSGRLRVLISGTASLREAKRLFEALSLAALRSFHLELSFLGLLPFEKTIRRAAERGHTVVTSDPAARAASGFRQIADALLRQQTSPVARVPALAV